jgi:transposase-like protein
MFPLSSLDIRKTSGSSVLLDSIGSLNGHELISPLIQLDTPNHFRYTKIKVEELSMKRRFRCPVKAKKEYVTEVLAGYRTEFVARKYGMSPKTLQKWVNEYRDEVGDLMVKKREESEKLVKDATKLHEVQKKYDEAVKLLGEKELEINILRELVKKKYPDWM